MPIVFFVETSIVVLTVVTVITQVVMPLWNDRPLFPVFRRKHKLQNDLLSAKEAVDEGKLEEQIQKTKSRVTRKTT